MITVMVIPHSEQRYKTCGDWYFVGPDLEIRVSDTGNELYNNLIAHHELFEAIACREMGITTEMVDKFDMDFTGEGEPGDDPTCPYRQQHQMATMSEKLLAFLTKVDWEEYEEAIDALSEKKEA